MHQLRLSDHQRCAADIVHDVIFNHKSLSGLLPVEQYNHKPVPAQDRSTIQHLVYTTLRHWGQARGCLRQICETPPPDNLMALIGVALVQLFWHSHQPAQVVDQAVEATRFMGLPAFSKLTNAVLRRALREKETLLAANERDTTSRFSCPAWWYKKLMNQYGAQATNALLESTLNHPPMTLRVNRRHTTAEEYRNLLQAEGQHSMIIGEDAIMLDNPVSVYHLPKFREGWVSVQDAGAQLVPHFLKLAPGARVLDACAAPGGKMAHLMERYPEIQMVAIDHDADRVKQLTATLQRLQLRAIHVETADAGDHAKKWWNRNPFDAIVLDVPCSGSGVTRRHPDIKWLRQPEDLAGFARQQKRLLSNTWDTLKPGGELLYITCSLFQEENQDIIRDFLDKTPSAERVVLEHPLIDTEGRLAPSDLHDGFFYAKLRKRT